MKKVIKIVLALVLAASSLGAMAAGDAAAVLASLKQRIARDGRTAVWDVNTTTQDGQLVVYGTVGTQEQKDAVTKELNDNGLAGCDNRLIVLENTVDPGKRWALVKLSIASCRVEGSHAAEMATQAIMGTPVKVIQLTDEWARVVTPDGYISYVPQSSITFMTAQQLQAWRKATRYIVTTYDSRLVTEPKGDATVSDLVLGNILEYKGKKGKWLLLATPDGRQGYVPQTDVQELSQWAQQPFSAQLVESTARRMMGSSYLWGGTSTKVTDCSGLAKVSYFACGIILQRDASQQALTGMKIAGTDWRQCKLGDLLFFGNNATGRVTHVGIYLHDGYYIHCSGQVKINNLDPADPSYLYDPISCSRIDGQEGSTGITWVRNHPWYF